MTWCADERLRFSFMDWVSNGERLRHKGWFVAAVWCVALCAELLVATGRASAADDRSGDSRRLVAIGDGFAAGSGIAGAKVASDGCHRSPSAFPEIVALRLHADVVNVACERTGMADLAGTDEDRTSQVAAAAHADIVLVMAIDVTADSIFEQDVKAVLGALKRAAPSAEIFVIGYPGVFPASQDDLRACLGEAGQDLRVGDLAAQVTLVNGTLSRVAKIEEVGYIDTQSSFIGHELCTSEPFVDGLDDPNTAFLPNGAGSQRLAETMVTAIEEQGVTPDTSGNGESLRVDSGADGGAKSSPVGVAGLVAALFVVFGGGLGFLWFRLGRSRPSSPRHSHQTAPDDETNP